MTAADLTPAPAIPVVLAAGSVLASPPGRTLAGPGRCFEGHRLRRPGPGTSSRGAA